MTADAQVVDVITALAASIREMAERLAGVERLEQRLLRIEVLLEKIAVGMGVSPHG